MLADYHVHTIFSDDSDCLMEDMVKQAIALKMDEICFTDHVDYGVKYDHDKKIDNCLLNVDYPNYFKEIENLRNTYKNQISIKRGMEFGVQMHTIPQFVELYKKYTYDFIILSCHQIDDKEFCTYDYQKNKSQDEYQQEYYQAIYRVIQNYKNYSVLGHLDMIKRYDIYGDYPDTKIMDIIEKILKQIILDGKGLEVNTSCFRYGLKDLTPSKTILKKYYELGGRILTIGSDAHATCDLCDHIEEVKEVLKEIGFKKICIFENMKPIFVDI